MAGVSRRLLESEAPEQYFESFRRELVLLVSAYPAAPAAEVQTTAAALC